MNGLFNSFILSGRGVCVQKIGVFALEMAGFHVVGAVLECFGRFWGAKRHFFSFFGVTSPLREGVEVFGATTHLLNVTPHFRFARRAKR
ncbi:MAG TPA: hypothetical protein PLJ55_05665, partial [Kiritimatiellia bacterium]|nr:hypothetical protein [Kiritimatiellia bacterium]